MNESLQEQFRVMLTHSLAELEQEDELGKFGQKTVELDQQSVGRLSRMDALQQQAMSKATQVRRSQMKSRILTALARMDADEYGYCLSCGEEIAQKRLELDPTHATCISCASG